MDPEIENERKHGLDNSIPGARPEKLAFGIPQSEVFCLYESVAHPLGKVHHHEKHCRLFDPWGCDVIMAASAHQPMDEKYDVCLKCDLGQ
jgi:hypothetical protein